MLCAFCILCSPSTTHNKAIRGQPPSRRTAVFAVRSAALVPRPRNRRNSWLPQSLISCALSRSIGSNSAAPSRLVQLPPLHADLGTALPIPYESKVPAQKATASVAIFRAQKPAKVMQHVPPGVNCAVGLCWGGNRSVQWTQRNACIDVRQPLHLCSTPRSSIPCVLYASRLCSCPWH